MRMMQYLFLSLFFLTTPALAEGDEVAPAHQEWPHAGITGTFDRAALQRGFQVYKEVCAACHSMHLLSYRNLTDLGYSEDEIKALATQVQVTDGPDDTGKMFQRPGKPSDRFVSPFANEQEARAANGGALPPDLSLIVKAREHGEDYIHALLTGYDKAPEGHEVPAGQYWNTYFSGHLISMPPPLNEGQVTYADGTQATVEQMSRDVTTFLAWAAEPKMEARKQMGIKVLIFLAVFTGIMYAVKVRLWRNVE
ncbi:MAG: cytochrome c1 [Pseudomonadota bacterium]|nr:cytochrome c1 [Pseudomonadota bacterium]